MPLGREGSLKPDEVYSLVAFLLFRNDVIKSEDEVLDAKTLPAIKMPNLSDIRSIQNGNTLRHDS